MFAKRVVLCAKYTHQTPYNRKGPIDIYDTVTKAYVILSMPLKAGGKKGDELSYSLGHSRLQDIASPKLDGDAVYLMYIKNNIVIKKKVSVSGAKFETFFYAGRTNIRNVNSEDIVNLTYIKENNLMKNKNKKLDANYTIIENLSSSEKSGDTLTKGYLDSRIPISRSEAFNFRDKILSQVASPRNISDADTLECLQTHIIKLEEPKQQEPLQQQRPKTITRSQE